METFSTQYNPLQIEPKWYEFWEKNNFFHADENSSKPAYSIVMPPPNVTGALHMGHALDLTLPDILVRWKRMLGYNVLWLPGTDHAGIATQNVVKKDLLEKKIEISSLNREKFIEKVWEWKEKYGNTITKQLRRLGASCDWQRERFTLDEGLSLAVKEVFINLYKEGLIYQGNYITNWCPTCLTALSDIEVEYHEMDVELYYIKYRLKDTQESLIIATTRPETILGDTAVAVNPEDERYKKYIGKTVIIPVINREIKVIADNYVDKNFGTGVLKVTPGHDPNDFEIGQRHNLQQLNIFNKDASINDGKYKGQNRLECRKNLLKDLGNSLIQTEKYKTAIGHCYRCHTIIEPLLSKQWFVKTKDLADNAIKAVKDGKIRLIPNNWEKTYYEWLTNIKDWCISRQLWWGHRIPVWYCKNCNEIYVTVETPIVCKKCNFNEFHQDDDVLDTWFSSALWPFSTLGWPKLTKDLEIFYPTSVLITGFDIIFFWVARMIMMGLKFMKEVPFLDVYFHALVRDFEGKKMSKSKGNVIDPIKMMDKYGTDAFRFTLAAFTVQGRDIILSEKRIEGYRNFCNKIWNASRFVLINIDQEISAKNLQLELADLWIQSRYQQVIKSVTKNLENYHFDIAAKVLYQFVWHEFCDWYIELAKIRLYRGNNLEKQTAQYFLSKILKGNLQLLHPFMPFITEEIWQKLQTKNLSIMISSWPKYNENEIDNDAIEKMNLIISLITSVRNICGEINIPAGKKITINISVNNQEQQDLLAKYENYLKFLTSAEKIIIGQNLIKEKETARTVVKDIDVYIPLKGIIDIDKEKDRLNKEILKIEQRIKIIDEKFKDETFKNKAPKEIIEQELKKEKELHEIKNKLTKSLKEIS